MTEQHGLRIGEVAERAAVSVATLRYYEARGLLRPARGPGAARDTRAPNRSLAEDASGRTARWRRVLDGQQPWPPRSPPRRARATRCVDLRRASGRARRQAARH